MLWHSEAPIFIQPEAVKNSSLVCSHHCVMHMVQLKYHQPSGPSVIHTRHNQLSTDNPCDTLAINIQYTLTIQVILWPQTFNTETNHKNMDQEKEPTHFILSCRDTGASTDNLLPVPAMDKQVTLTLWKCATGMSSSSSGRLTSSAGISSTRKVRVPPTDSCSSGMSSRCTDRIL